MVFIYIKKFTAKVIASNGAVISFIRKIESRSKEVMTIGHSDSAICVFEALEDC